MRKVAARRAPSPVVQAREADSPVTPASSVRHDLRRRIEQCELMPGDRLKFDELRLYYPVSVAALREELLVLESEGIVQSERNRGFQVSPVSIRELLDLTELRILLERQALAQSIEAGDDAWEANVVATAHMLSLMEAERRDATAFDPLWAQRHQAFHLALLAACPSEWTLRYCRQLMSLLHRYLCLSMRYRARKPNRSADHERLAKLAAARRADAACDLLEEHLRATVERILRSVPDFRRT